MKRPQLIVVAGFLGVSLSTAFAVFGSSALLDSHRGLSRMTQDNENQHSDRKALDPLAMEAAREIAKPLIKGFGEIYESSLSPEDQEKEIEKHVKEMNVRVNELYRQKLQEKEP